MEPSSQTTGGEEKKYVTLETGSKLSGYTQEYLERLCRLKKVDYRIWNNGQFVIELGSLLRETQTILLSNDGISFVDKGELADPVPEVVGSMLSSALKEVTTTVATPEVTTPVMPIPNTVLAQETETLSGSDNASVAPTPGVAQVSPAPASEVPPMSVPVVPPSIPVSSEALVMEKGGEQIQQVLAPSIPAVTSVEVAPDSLTSEPMIVRTPIARAPVSIPTPPRPIKINTAVENITPPASVTSPVPVSSPVEEMRIPAPQVESNVSVVTEKEVVPITPSLEVHIPVPQVASSVKQTVPFGSLPGGVPVTEEVVVEQAPAHDEWDAMLFGGAPVAPDIVPKSTPAPIPERASLVNREYHPIQTSVDPRPHHDDGPLFPVLNPSGVVRPDDVQVKSAAPVVVAPEQTVPTPFVPTAPSSSPVSESYGSGQRVVVYEPKDLLSNERKGESSIPSAPLAASASSTPLIPKKPGAIYNELPTLPSTSVTEKPIPVVPSAIIRKEGSVPSLRVMPALPVVQQNNLPMKMEEHHLIVEEEHSLIKNVGLNLAFAAVLIGSSVLLLNSTYPELGKKLGDIGSTSYIAGVGAALTKDVPEATSPAPKQPSELELPFSDEVIVDLGSKQNSVIVRPVFKTGTGASYEYAITPIATTSVNLE